MAKSYRIGIAAMLAADAELEILPRFPSALRSDSNEFADALHIDRDKRIAGNHTL